MGKIVMPNTRRDAYQLIHDGTLAFSRAERQGIRVDVAYCEQMREQLTQRISSLEEGLKRTELYNRWEQRYQGKTNIDSSTQLAGILYETMGIKPLKQTPTGRGGTDEEALKALGRPELDAILQMRKLAKVRDTYLGAFLREQRDGWIHPAFLLHTVRTYRSSSADPNLQNVPKRDEEAMRICRRALLPRPGHQFLEMDFASLEVHIAALYSKDPVLIQYLQDKNSDMHLDMAKQLFVFETLDRTLPAHNILRQAAKGGFVFPQFYGDYYVHNAAGLAEWVSLPQTEWRAGTGLQLPDGKHISDHLLASKIRSYREFVEHVRGVEDDFWNNRFRGYNAWRQSWVEKYRRKGWLQMLTGFVCSGELRRNEILNYPIQGTAFHCLLLTFIKLDEAMRQERWDSRLVGQIHDSILVDANPEEVEHIAATTASIVKEHLPTAWPWIIIPLEIEVEQYAVDGAWVK